MPGRRLGTATTITDNDTATWSLSGTTCVTEASAPATRCTWPARCRRARRRQSIWLSPTAAPTSADYAHFVTAVNAAIAWRTTRDPGQLRARCRTRQHADLHQRWHGQRRCDATWSSAWRRPDDTLVEGPENYTVALTNPGSTTGSSVAGSRLGDHHHHRQRHGDLVAHGHRRVTEGAQCGATRCTWPARCRRARRRQSIWLSPMAAPPAPTMRAS